MPRFEPDPSAPLAERVARLEEILSSDGGLDLEALPLAYLHRNLEESFDFESVLKGSVGSGSLAQVPAARLVGQNTAWTTTGAGAWTQYVFNQDTNLSFTTKDRSGNAFAAFSANGVTVARPGIYAVFANFLLDAAAGAYGAILGITDSALAPADAQSNVIATQLVDVPAGHAPRLNCGGLARVTASTTFRIWLWEDYGPAAIGEAVERPASPSLSVAFLSPSGQAAS